MRTSSSRRLAERWEEDGPFSEDGVAVARLPGIEELDLKARRAVVASQAS